MCHELKTTVLIQGKNKGSIAKIDSGKGWSLKLVAHTLTIAQAPSTGDDAEEI